ncbi:hypothetical protein ASPCAL08025 [Aspergillus calidoustus]|uniref:Carrier domain-containing protein n=1 Tax=Aspergillus calidoustus TaxID=454130 RepID=A0A0U5GS94_ASPCI|nr:hypothetical protein ASPCAL08025 [Aspergillus calidoustus]
MPNHTPSPSDEDLLPTLITTLSKESPQTLWAEYPSSPKSYNLGFTQITYAQFANAINNCAHFLAETLGRSDTGEPLAWLAPNDPRCAIANVAAMRAGFKIFLISERNSVAANYKLFDEVQCSTILTTSLAFAPVQATQAGDGKGVGDGSRKQLVVIELPSLETLLTEIRPEYPFHKTLSASAREAALIVHTSGSTGFPKPMFITHEFLAKTMRNFRITAPAGYITQTSLIEKKQCVCFLPIGHPAGVTFTLLLPLTTQCSIILPLSHIPPTGEALVEILRHTSADWAALAPLTLETMSKNISLLDVLDSKLETLVFSGGSLPKVFGDEIAQRRRLKLLSFLGSSETGPLQAIYREGYDFVNDWNYLQFPEELGARFDLVPDRGSRHGREGQAERDEDGGVYELVFTKTPATAPYQAVFASYPDLTEFRTKDLFTKHSSIPNLWTHASRSDDVIVFLNGEKVNPVDFESRVCRHPTVAAALMFGEKRFEAGVLVELVDSQKKGDLSVAERAKVVKDIWPVIEDANAILPAYARVDEAHIVFTEVGKSVLRTLKGTVRRAATLELHKEAIEKVYTDVEEMEGAVPGQLRRAIGSEVEVQELVRQAVQETMKIDETEMTEDFFSRGMDSLQVLRLIRHLRGGTALTGITPSMVYLNASISALSSAIYQLAQNKQISEQQKQEDQLNIRREILQRHLDAIDALDTKPSSSQRSKNEGKVILVTGSTGTIGSYILSVLLDREDIDHIYCLNRSLNSETLQREHNAHQDPALPITFPESKVTFLTVDLAHPILGLDGAVYEALRDRATHIIHNAWKVDFNLPLQAFEPQLLGTVNLIRLCASASRAPTIVFISSVSAVMNFSSTFSYQSTNQTPIPESIIEDISAPASAGYAESKYIAERLLSHAADRLRISAKIIRLGQIAGAAKSPGSWNAADWVPALVLGSTGLGAIPDALDGGVDGGGVIDWVPVDSIAEVIVDIGVHYDSQHGPSSDSNSGDRAQRDADTSTGSGDVSIFHPLNPHGTTWSSLLPPIISVLESQLRPGSHHDQSQRKRAIEVVPPAEWLSRLRAAARQSLSTSDGGENLPVSRNPALRLLEFFSQRLDGVNAGPETKVWETGNAKRVSKALRGVQAIDGELMGRWVEQWVLGMKE